MVCSKRQVLYCQPATTIIIDLLRLSTLAYCIWNVFAVQCGAVPFVNFSLPCTFYRAVLRRMANETTNDDLRIRIIQNHDFPMFHCSLRVPLLSVAAGPTTTSNIDPDLYFSCCSRLLWYCMGMPAISGIAGNYLGSGLAWTCR